ncbi:hypothetical protein [Oceanospirillum sanctuarii]|uniref:hypothetical protein n=1 Tax=Oceanospirillum sanctuarii TaxID=1434821 RepID=UPI000A3A4163|nr:hypothetical protein [Oceanospirillum sanctuarii]
MVKQRPENVSGIALAKRLGFYFLLGMYMLVAPLAIYTDMVVLQQEISETSLTEILQESFLLLSLMFYLVLYGQLKVARPFWALVAAFYGVLFIRELDMFLDVISHGFWKYPALLVAAAGIYIGLKGWQQTRRELYCFLETPGGVFTAFGVLLVLFFSRLFGSSKIWEPIMQENYLDIYKAAIQEGIELYGYSIIFVGSLLTLIRYLKNKEVSDETA